MTEEQHHDLGRQDRAGTRVFEPSVDREVLIAAVPAPGTAVAAMLRPITGMADGLKPWLLASGILLARDRSSKRAMTVVIGWGAIVIATVASGAVKGVVDRQRPAPEQYGLEVQGGKDPKRASFPSSHTASSVAFATGTAIADPY